jgi:hypothetical protein
VKKMPSDLFQNFGSPAQQNPRDQAMSLLRQRGIQIPDGIAGNPQAIIQHLMQSGQIPQGRLNMAQQIMQRMFRR